MTALRPYQERAITDLRSCILAGSKSVVLILPTGGGKTIIASEIATRHVAVRPERRPLAHRRVLFLAHRAELISQAARKLQDAGLHRIRVITAGSSAGPVDAPITVASIPTLSSKRWRDSLPAASMVIFDEVHHVKSATWGRLASAYRDALLIGLTATPERGDGSPLGDVFDDFVVCSTVRELTAEGWLVPCEVYAPESAMPHLAEHPADAYVYYATTAAWKRATGWRPTGGRAVAAPTLASVFATRALPSTDLPRKGIVFCNTVHYAETVAAKLQSVGIPSGCVHGGLSAADRHDRLKRFASGEIRVIANAMVLTEGYDEPSAEVAVLARGCIHAGIFLQCVGRILRPSPGKRSALLIDLRGAVRLHGMPDEERVYTLTGSVAIGRADGGSLPIQQCKVCGACYPPAPLCPRCGAATPAPPPPRIERAPLSQVFANDADDVRFDYFRGLCATMRAKNYHHMWVNHRYRAKYGEWPRWKLSDLARSHEGIDAAAAASIVATGEL